MKKRFIYLLIPIFTLILEILPYGAVLVFAKPYDEAQRETFSYFSLIPFGYANFTPLITAIITCIILVLLIIYCITGKQHIAIMARNLLVVAVIISLGPLLYGISFFSVIGVLITVSLIGEATLIQLMISKSDD